MTRQRTTIGLRLGIALGAAIALIGVAIGVAIASIPAPDGSVNACYRVSTGALRVVDSSKKCAAGEKSLRWNQSGARGPAGPANLSDVQCAAGNASGSLVMQVNPAGGAVTLVCKTSLTVTSTMTLTEISFSAATQPSEGVSCHNAKVCTGSFPLGTSNVVVQLFGTEPFHYTCPGGFAQANYFGSTHAVTLGQCDVSNLRANSAISVTP